MKSVMQQNYKNNYNNSKKLKSMKPKTFILS